MQQIAFAMLARLARPFRVAAPGVPGAVLLLLSGLLPGLLSVLLAGLLMALLPAATEAQVESPSMLLAGANIPRAKALALDAALLKGWSVAQSEREYVIFETLLAEPASDGPPGAAALDKPKDTLLRIRADFIETPAGISVTLKAEEVWYRDRPSRWSTDVTAQYRANLMNALNSLRAQWVALDPGTSAEEGPPGAPKRGDASLIERMRTLLNPRPALVPSPQPAQAPSGRMPVGTEQPAATTGRRSAPPSTGRAAEARPPPGAAASSPAPAPQPDTATDAPVGVWAYYAERYAESQGCTLADRGAVLMDERDGVELHRVYCAGGTALSLRCDREGCAAAQ